MMLIEMQQLPLTFQYKAVFIGGSAGGMKGLHAIFSSLSSDFELPVFVAQHLPSNDDGAFALHMARRTTLTVIEPFDKERIESGRVYIAPANYHMLVERGGTISLSVDEKVNWSRPSIDVLFDSAAACWGEEVIAVLLSGSNGDGANGLISIKEAGGLTIAQDPEDAESPFMPKAAIKAGAAHKILKAGEIGLLLSRMSAGKQV